MDPSVWIILIIVLAVAAAAAVLYQQQRTHQLRARFGPEYDRSVRESGDRRRAEAELQKRAERVSRLDIRPLSRENRAQFGESWSTVQARCVEHPKQAMSDGAR